MLEFSLHLLGYACEHTRNCSWNLLCERFCPYAINKFTKNSKLACSTIQMVYCCNAQQYGMQRKQYNGNQKFENAMASE